MKVFAFLTDFSVVDRIIGHLKLTFVAERPPPPQVFEQVALQAAEESGEYFQDLMIRRERESIIFQPVREDFPSKYAFRARFSHFSL